METDQPLNSNQSSPPAANDSPNVLVFPPALLAGTLLLGLSLTFLRPWSLFTAARPPLFLRAGAGVMILLGFSLLTWGRTTMVRAGTNVPPNKPSLKIVTEGPFRFTRNPLYLGGNLVYLGLAIMLGSLWLLCLFVPMFLALRWGIVQREERYLEAKFGPIYLAYKARVRRWV